jgi:hypothetical protein
MFSCPRGCETLLFLISRGGIEGEIGTFFYHYYYYFYRLHARGTAREHYGKHDQVAKNFPVRQRFVGYTPTKIGKGAAAIKKLACLNQRFLCKLHTCIAPGFEYIAVEMWSTYNGLNRRDVVQRIRPFCFLLCYDDKQR